MNALQSLADHGQAVWLDFLSRKFIADGGLKKLVDDDGLRGVTSNPSIFEHAIGHSDEYDGAIARMLRERDRAVGEIFEELAVEDIKHATDVLRPVFDATHGADGYVSIEVSPYLAKDTAATIEEGKRLWHAVDRKNLMIKVPATPEGLPAVRALIADGINVNITLLFAQQVYERVVDAYLSGLEARAAKGGDISRLASVASFFVSRIDSAVDKLIDEKLAKANDPDEKARLNALKGKVAIANAKLAYQRFLKLVDGKRWQALAAKGAKPQRLLWASTGTKNKAYSDVLYVEELIGRDTVNTMPTATMDAFRDHGKVRDSLEKDAVSAKQVLDDLGRSGISLDGVTDKLVEEGVQLFADAADKLYAAVAGKRARVLADKIGQQSVALNDDSLVRAAVETGADWRTHGKVRRLWQRDKSLWTNADEDRWLGWLDAVTADEIKGYEVLASEVRRDGFKDALLLGMGGSSLGPEVLATTFGQKAGFPRLRILDSTVPAQIRAIEATLDIRNTLFIVSSKSGSTTEPNVLKDYFFKRVADAGEAKPGRQFIAITDPGSALEKTATADGFCKVFFGVPSIGGRYSVLSPFGLVPAAIAGVDVAALVEATRLMAHSCGPETAPTDNPGVVLGIGLGVAAAQGRDKVTIFASPGLAGFGAWAEQLFAESTGKNGDGLIPIDGEPIAAPEVYGNDRFFIDLKLEGDAQGDAHGDAHTSHEAKLAALEKAGHPVVRIVQKSPLNIGQEFFRFEIATAVAGAVIGIDPFDQPDVEASKIKTRELTAAFEKTGSLPAETPVFSGPSIDIYTDDANAKALRQAGADGSIDSFVKAHLARIRGGDYFAALAYIARDAAHAAVLQQARLAVRDRRHVATCLEFGPRFLHSTGQAYKGGPNSGVFLQITADDAEDLAVPGHRTSFGVVKAAQARGDFGVLVERGRRALRLHIKGDLHAGLAAVAAAIARALV
jgi:transaldolase/glucose-6-phosphate isomerase